MYLNPISAIMPATAASVLGLVSKPSKRLKTRSVSRDFRVSRACSIGGRSGTLTTSYPSSSSDWWAATTPSRMERIAFCSPISS